MRLVWIFPALITAPAGAFDLSLPIDCTLGQTCHIQQFVDRDPGPGAQDFTCGPLTYDGHKGTDFALPTLADLNKDVQVLAAAPGRVTGVRDTMRDQLYNAQTAVSVDGRECGNGVLIRHDDGFETQYCHLKQGSVSVRMGQMVSRGDALGAVGLSGKTQFPHLHFSLRRNGEVVDPFSAGNGSTCREGGPVLWESDVPYRGGGLLDAGFASGVPDYDDVKAGTAAQSALSPTAEGLVLFTLAFGGREGDQLHMVIDGPTGRLFDQSVDLEKAQAQFFRAGGKRRTTTRWPAGRYHGTIRHLRDGQEIDRITTTTRVP